MRLRMRRRGAQARAEILGCNPDVLLPFAVEAAGAVCPRHAVASHTAAPRSAQPGRVGVLFSFPLRICVSVNTEELPNSVLCTCKQRADGAPCSCSYHVCISRGGAGGVRDTVVSSIRTLIFIVGGGTRPRVTLNATHDQQMSGCRCAGPNTPSPTPRLGCQRRLLRCTRLVKCATPRKSWASELGRRRDEQVGTRRASLLSSSRSALCAARGVAAEDCRHARPLAEMQLVLGDIWFVHTGAYRRLSSFVLQGQQQCM
jgi:hypothetical protein